MIKGVLVSCALVAGAAALLTARIEPAPPPVAVARGAAPAAGPRSPAPVGNGVGGVVIERAPDSHFYVEGQVNGARVRFIVDTGATSVVLTQADARRAGLGAGDYSATGVGAGGGMRLMPVTVTRIALGPLTADNVPAMVAERALPASLLGQSFLARVEAVTIEGDRMVLR